MTSQAAGAFTLGLIVVALTAATGRRTGGQLIGMGVLGAGVGWWLSAPPDEVVVEQVTVQSRARLLAAAKRHPDPAVRAEARAVEQEYERLEAEEARIRATIQSWRTAQP